MMARNVQKAELIGSKTVRQYLELKSLGDGMEDDFS